jgi:predicted RNA-binding protein with PIN domain
MAGKR